MAELTAQTILSVHGEVSHEVDPEVATVHVTTRVYDADRDRAIKLLNDRAGAVAAIIDRFEEVIEKTQTSPIRIGAQMPRPGTKRDMVYLGWVRHTVTIDVAHAENLGELLTQLASLYETEIDGPYWSLRPGSAAYRTARAQAARDAVERASDYAAALGSHLSGLVELADTNLLTDGRAIRTGSIAFAASRGGGEPERPEAITIDVEPVKQIVAARVDARFTMTTPDLTSLPEP